MNSVCTDIRKSEKGFTFISIFFAISIIFMTIPFAAYLIRTVDVDSNYNQLSAQQFFLFVRDEAIKASAINIEPTKITFEQPDGSVVSLQKYGDRIIRQRDHDGFEEYLRDVRDVQFDSSAYGFRISITSIDGDQYDKQIIVYD